jgi:hypothetical protein
VKLATRHDATQQKQRDMAQHKQHDAKQLKYRDALQSRRASDKIATGRTAMRQQKLIRSKQRRKPSTRLETNIKSSAQLKNNK